jgi:hypothetical protein
MIENEFWAYEEIVQSIQYCCYVEEKWYFGMLWSDIMDGKRGREMNCAAFILFVLGP